MREEEKFEGDYNGGSNFHGKIFQGAIPCMQIFNLILTLPTYLLINPLFSFFNRQ